MINHWLISRYLFIGFLTTATYYLIFLMLNKIMRLPLLLAVGIAYICFILINFSMHRSFTFKASNNAIQQHFSRYITLLLGNFLLTLLINFITKLYLLPASVGFFIAVGITSLIGFYVSKNWVFKK